MVRQLAHIVIPPREKRSATFRVFTAEITPEEEAERGILFGLFVIDYYHHCNEEIIDSIIEELQGRYYDPDIAVREPEELLEETLRSLNTTLAQLIENEQIFLNVKRFHAVIGVLRGKALTFTYVGDMRVYLMHQSMAQKQQLIDLLVTTEVKEEKTPPITRIFSHLVSGTLRTNDVLFTATGNILDHTTKERLQKILTSATPTIALEQIQSIVKAEKGAGGIVCLLLRIAPEHEMRDIPQSQQSIATLQATEENARRYLAPSLVRNAWNASKKTAQESERILRKLFRIPPTMPRSEIVLRVISAFLLFVRMLGRLVMRIKRFTVVLWRIGRELARQKDWSAAMATVQKESQRHLSGLSVRQRVVALTASLLGIILIVATATLGIQRSRTLKQQEYQKNIALIEERLATAEASRIFKDEVRTQTIYNEALQLIETLPKRTKEQRAERERLAGEVQKQLEKLRHVVPLARVAIVKDFKELDPAVEATSVLLVDNTAYVAHGSRPLVYKVNLENKQVVTLDASGVDIRPIENIAREEKGALLYFTFDAAGIAALKLDKQSVAPVDIEFGATGTTIKDMSFYNKRLYILDTANNQIWRHDKKEGGMSKGVAWLKAPADLVDARAFTIDGAVWIMKEHALVRFLQGKMTSWKLGAIDPPALSLRSLQTRGESNTLWLLDEAGKRVLAIAKDSGQLVAQYPLPADDIRDFSVNEKTKQILLLTKTRLLALEYEKE